MNEEEREIINLYGKRNEFLAAIKLGSLVAGIFLIVALIFLLLIGNVFVIIVGSK